MEHLSESDLLWVRKVAALSENLGQEYEAAREQCAGEYPASIVMSGAFLLELLDTCASLKGVLLQAALDRETVIRITKLCIDALTTTLT